MSTNYENQICEAIEYIVNHAIADAGFDKTIQATIVSCIDETIGQYKVKYQNSIFNAYSNSTEVSYLSGTEVYILVPQNDMSNTKTILGAVDKLGTDYVKTLELTDTHEIIGKNCIETNDSFELCSYKEKDVKILYNSQENDNLIKLDIIGLEEYIKTASHLMCGGYFKTALDKDQRFKGNYGIGFDLVFKSNTGDSTITRNYIVDIDQMTGSPYSLNNYTKQLGVFEVDGINFLYVDKIYIFSYDFPLNAEDRANDIFIKNIELTCAVEVSEEELTTYGLNLVTPLGIYFDGTDENDAYRTIQAQVKIQGKIVDNTIQKVDYYWFRENAKVDNIHTKYSKYGGRGWECLNSYNVIDGDLIDWIPEEFEYHIYKNECLAKTTNYKCVAVIGDAVIEKNIAIKNFASNYDISIQSTNGTQFYYDRGETNLICYVNGNEELENYSYVWVENTSIGGYNQLTETTEINNEYKQLKDEYNQLLLDIIDEKVLAANVQDQIDNYLTKLKEYDTIMKVDNNVIYNLKASGINNFSIYKCAVFYNETYIGTASITIVNTLEVENGYNLIINNGNITYQYNEDGISPIHRTLENPMEIKPLTFNIYDNLGVLLNEEALAECSIQWILPKDNTMIIPAETDYEETENSYIFRNKKELIYDLAPKYDINKNNNSIQLMIEYKGVSLMGLVSMSFTKQGNPGTNGTEYTCCIVPNIIDGNIVYPAIVNGQLNYEPEQENIWFKVQLWKNTDNIFEGTQSGTALEGGSVKVKWNILKNTYSKTIEDFSNLILKNATTGEFQYTPCNWRNSPANIIECEVEHAGMTYYATLPIVVIEQQLEGYNISWVKDTGFSYAIYSADGIQPKYNDVKPFELQVTKIINDIEEDISLLEKAEKLEYQWIINGTVYDLDENAWIDSLHLIENTSRLDKLNKNQFKVKPAETFGGHCVTNSITCIVVDTLTDETVGIITIPIYLCLNRYGLAALNGWNGNSVSINEDGGFILAPQVGAGKKEEDNSFTGIFMGVVKEKGTSADETGLFAYKKGIRSIFLDAETGNAVFGTKEGSQFIITPATVLDSGDTKVIAIHDNVKNEDVFYVTKDGQLVVRGDGSGLDITANKTIENLDGSISDLGARIEAVAGEIDISVTQDNIIQSINLSTEEGATINANKINLKGAVTISDFDNELANKIDDIDNQITKVEVQYYSSTSRVNLTGGTWGTETPSWQEGRYIWTKNVYYYQDATKMPGESNPVCITGNTGATGGMGVGISEIIEWYLVSDKDSGIVAGEGTWYNNEIPTMDATNRYLWNYEEIKYTQGQPSSITTAMIVGVYGENGQDGQPGRGIKSITEYYLATAKNTGITTATSGWKTNIAEATITAVNKYLWNYEVTQYTDNTSSETTPAIIGVYGDKGEDGTGIVSVTNYYLKSDKKTGITISGNTWVTTIPALDSTNKYLWNYEETVYTKGNPSTTTPHVVSIFTEDGKGILSIKEMYAASTDGSQPSKSSFNEVAPSLSSTNKYLWSYEIITYTKGDPTETEPHIIGVYGDDGKGIKETIIEYADSTNGTQWPTVESEWQIDIPTVDEGSFLWTRTTIVYTDETKSTSYSVSKSGSKGATGKGISNIVEQYYLSNSKTSQTGGNWVTTCPPYKSGYYYWTRSAVTWTDNNTTYTTAVLANGLNDSLGKASETAAELSEFSASVTATIESLQSQVDGQIESYYYDYEPTLSNAPADAWTTDNERAKHEGDLFYDKSTGLSYRFFYNEGNAEWEWTLIRDTEVSKALEAAEKAQDTADSKRRIFVSQPYAPYEIGDLWSDGTDLWRCKTDLPVGGTFSKSHWVLATNYTDDTIANNALNSANAKVSKVDIEYALGDNTTTAPTTGWNTDAPQWTEGKYMWQRTATYIGNATTPTYSQVTCIAGAKGTGIKSVTIEYQAGTSATTKPTGTWQPSVVNTEEGQYLWTRTTTKYTDSSIADSVSYSVSYHATNAKGVTITSNNGQIFKKAKGATSFTPATITLTATLVGGLSGYQWYKDGTAMSGKTSATLEVASSAPGVYKCVSGSYSDSITLAQLTDGSDGAKGTSYYTYIRYGTDASGANMTATPTASTKYIGVYSGTASTAPTTASSYTWSKYAGEDGAKGDTGDSGTSYYVWIKYADSTTPASNAMYDSPTGRTYVGIYSGTSSTAPTAYGSYKWSKIQGSDGTGYTILLSNESHTFPGSSTSAAAAATAETKITAYKNTTQQTITVNTVGGTAPGTSSSAATATGIPGLTCYITSNGTNTPILTFKSSTSLTTTSGNIAIVMTVDGKSFTKYFSFSIALKGGKGDTGNGITSTTIKYQVTSSGTTTPSDSGWKNSIAEAGGAGQGKYLWTQTTLTYADGSTKVSLTNSYQGKDGEKGLSITSIKNQYQASAGNTSDKAGLVEASWVDICPTYNSQKPYIWYRQYVTWSEGDPTKTTPVLLESLSNTTKQAYDAHAAMTSWAKKENTTYIDGAKIYTGSIGAEQIYVEDLIALDATIAGWTIGEDEIYTVDGNSIVPNDYMECDGLGIVTQAFNTGVKRDSTSTLLKIDIDFTYLGWGDSDDDFNLLTIGTDRKDLSIYYTPYHYNGQMYCFSVNGYENTRINSAGVKINYVFEETSSGLIATPTFSKGSPDQAYFNGTAEKLATNTTDSLIIANNPDYDVDHTYIILHRCAIYKNGTLVRHYYPAQRKSDSVYGLYDTVNKTFTALSAQPISISKPGYVGLTSKDISATIGGYYSHDDFRIVANNAFGVRKTGDVYASSIEAGRLSLQALPSNGYSAQLTISGKSDTVYESRWEYSTITPTTVNLQYGGAGSSVIVPSSQFYVDVKQYTALRLGTRSRGGISLEVNDYGPRTYYSLDVDRVGEGFTSYWGDEWISWGYLGGLAEDGVYFGLGYNGNSEEHYGSPMQFEFDMRGNYTGRMYLNAPNGLYCNNKLLGGSSPVQIFKSYGTNGNITLTQSASQFDYLIITYMDMNMGNEVATMVLAGPGNKMFNISATGTGYNGEVVIMNTNYDLSYSSISPSSYGNATIESFNYPFIDYNNEIYIYEIYGCKF